MPAFDFRQPSQHACLCLCTRVHVGAYPGLRRCASLARSLILQKVNASTTAAVQVDLYVPMSMSIYDVLYGNVSFGTFIFSCTAARCSTVHVRQASESTKNVRVTPASNRGGHGAAGVCGGGAVAPGCVATATWRPACGVGATHNEAWCAVLGLVLHGGARLLWSLHHCGLMTNTS